jgi:hypothetical protein
MKPDITFQGWLRPVLLSASLLALTGCNTPFTANNPPEGIGFREARYEEITSMRSYRSCLDEALEMDSQARASGSKGKYIASARLLETCESELGPESAGVAMEDRMRAYALSIMDYLKGGDLQKANKNFQQFKQTFSGQDLYYGDGSSFVDTMEVLLKQTKPNQFARFSLLNVNETLKSEMRRIDYWSRN